MNEIKNVGCFYSPTHEMNFSIECFVPSMTRFSYLYQVWFLHLLNVTREDEGEYECQLSTHPHTSTIVHLTVAGMPQNFNQKL